jgi:hypothetical protein
MSGAAQAVQAAIVRVDCAAWFKTLQRGTDTKLVGRPDSCNLHRFANLYFRLDTFGVKFDVAV